LQQWSMNYFDRFIMLFFLPLSDIGVYDFAVKCMLAIEFVISGVYNSFYPKVINIVVGQIDKKSTPEINRYYHGLIALIMVLVCFSILAFSIIMDLGILKSGYEASVKFLPLIGLVYLLRAIRYYFAFPFGALKFSKPLPMIYFVISAVKICLIVLLVGPFGVPGVIQATFISTIMEIILLWYFIRKRFDFKFNKFKIIGAPLLLGVIIVIFQTFSLLPVYLTYILYIVICFMVLGLLYRNELKVLVSGKLIR
jgi:O-antigen/teichoic acid export membrane protein